MQLMPGDCSHRNNEHAKEPAIRDTKPCHGAFWKRLHAPFPAFVDPLPGKAIIGKPRAFSLLPQPDIIGVVNRTGASPVPNNHRDLVQWTTRVLPVEAHLIAVVLHLLLESFGPRQLQTARLRPWAPLRETVPAPKSRLGSIR